MQPLFMEPVFQEKIWGKIFLKVCYFLSVWNLMVDGENRDLYLAEGAGI